jgi:transcriptional regulator with XRE-family HTH domain
LLHQKRLEKGLSDVEVAEAIDLPVMWLHDVEHHDDEHQNNLGLSKFEKLCSIVGANFYVIVSDYCDVGKSCEVLGDYAGLRRHEIIAKRRRELGISISEVSDAVGFFEDAIEKVEATYEGLDNLNLDFLRDLSKLLRVPATLLVFS